VAYFYKPPQDGTSASFLATHTQFILLTHADEPYMAQLRRAGYAGPILQVTAANEAEGPGPYANAHARCDASYPTYQRTVADRNGVFCRELHPHEDWFLHNLRGERLYTRYQSANGVWRTTYLMNPASPGWQHFLLARLRQYRRLGYDGFFLDNVDLSRAGMLRDPPDKGGVAEMPSDAALRAAVVTYLRALRAAFPHVPLWANLTHDPNARGGWEAYLPFLDGVMVEDFAAGWQTYPLSAPERADQLANARTALAQGKGLIAVVQVPPPPNDAASRARLRLGLALYWALLPSGPAPAGRTPAGLYLRFGDAFTADYRTFPWYPEYDFSPGAAQQPLQVNHQRWSRRFAGGELRVDLDSGGVTLPEPLRGAQEPPERSASGVRVPASNPCRSTYKAACSRSLR